MADDSTTPDVPELTRLVFQAVNRRDIDAVMGFFAARVSPAVAGPA
jgi:hypothetical protein